MDEQTLDNFAKAVGKRAGIAEPDALFEITPTGSSKHQASLLEDAIHLNKYQVVLDALSKHPHLVDERPLSRQLMDHLCEYTVNDLHDELLADAQVFARMLGIDDETWASQQTKAAQIEAKKYVRGWLPTALSKHDELQEGEYTQAVIYGLYHSLIDSCLVYIKSMDIEQQIDLLGTEIARQLRDIALMPQSRAHLLGQTDFTSALGKVFVHGIAGHNYEAKLTDLQNALADTIWNVMGVQRSINRPL